MKLRLFFFFNGSVLLLEPLAGLKAFDSSTIPSHTTNAKISIDLMPCVTSCWDSRGQLEGNAERDQVLMGLHCMLAGTRLLPAVCWSGPQCELVPKRPFPQQNSENKQRFPTAPSFRSNRAIGTTDESSVDSLVLLTQ